MVCFLGSSKGNGSPQSASVTGPAAGRKDCGGILGKGNIDLILKGFPPIMTSQVGYRLPRAVIQAVRFFLLNTCNFPPLLFTGE